MTAYEASMLTFVAQTSPEQEDLRRDVVDNYLESPEAQEMGKVLVTPPAERGNHGFSPGALRAAKELEDRLSAW